jgi:pimeloyl-ACP methyl ester carboxylesterase
MFSPWLTLIAMIVAVGLLLSLAVIVLMARILLRPPRMDDGKALFLLQRLGPEDLNLRYENAMFTVRDEATGQRLKIAAWWIPHPPLPHSRGRTVVLIHGYADAKVGAIAWAPLLHSLGLNILAIDLRAHGESGGTHTTAGYFERHDLNQVLDQFRELRPADARQLFLFGISLGAAVAVASAVMRSDIAGIVLEGPYADYRSAAVVHAGRMGLPGGLFARAAISLAERLAGVDFDAVRPADLIRQVHCPVFIIHASDDLFVTPDDMTAVETALAQRPEGFPAANSWTIAGAAHVMGLAHVPAQYRRRLEEFFASTHAPAAAAVSSLREEGQ